MAPPVVGVAAEDFLAKADFDSLVANDSHIVAVGYKVVVHKTVADMWCLIIILLLLY
jgi:hypothetical protein